MLTTTWDAFWLPGSLWHWCVSFLPVQVYRTGGYVCESRMWVSYRRSLLRGIEMACPQIPYAIIHRNGVGCQILYVASQRRVGQIELFDADKPRRANALCIHTPQLRCVATQNTTRRHPSVGWFGGSHRAGGA
jgi:hypothetical protein